ncbi:DsbA family protein [Staphylospora marina]|uniref:DsbA family protein n=1 Tax=Staphylospora marina TaxID=2490858 RepID=UPI000F5C1200|nr:DsbA family protein [Staphylospora marina]
MTPKKKKSSIFDMQTLIVLTLVLFVGLGVYAIFQSVGQTGETDAPPLTGVDPSAHPTIGQASAPVKLVEFGDFKCPACKMFHDSIWPVIKKEYIDTGKAQMTFVNFQFIGPDSITAGMAGEAVYRQNPDAFWKFYEAVYANQGEESKQWATPEFLTDLIRKHVPEVDADKVAQDLAAKTHEKDVLDDNRLAQKNQIDGVPAVYVNGKKVNGLDLNELKAAIEKELNGK